MPDDAGLSEQAARILAQFPGPVTLNPSTSTWVPYFVILASVAALGTWGLFWDEFDSPIGLNWHTLQGAFLIVVGGLGAVMSGIALCTRVYILKLDAIGFEFPVVVRRARCAWRDADRFTTTSATVKGFTNYFVVFDDASFTSRFWNVVARALKKPNRQLPETYGLNAEDLAHLLTAWRERALTTPTAAQPTALTPTPAKSPPAAPACRP